MISKPLVAAFLAAGCIGAAAGGAYVAVRQNDGVPRQAQSSVDVQQPPASPAQPSAPVEETEAVVTPATPEPESRKAAPLDVEAPERDTEEPKTIQRAPQPERATRRARAESVDRSSPAERRSPATPAAERPVRSEQIEADADRTAGAAAERSALPAAVPREVPDLPPPPPEPQFIQVILPASTVIGLHVETTLSSERARLEDRVDARVTRDVTASGRVAIPAGSRVIGSVTLVERGGKVKERARLGVRFHTLVFADGTELPIRTDAIFREGEAPGGESARKIGGATVGGAILGAILGGGKGAAIGGAAGAAGGTAVVMAGDRNPASLTAGTIVTVRLSEPLAIDVEKRN